MTWLDKVKTGVDIAKGVTEVVEKCHKISKSDLSRAEMLMDQLKMTSLKETTRAEMREFQPDGFHDAINKWKVRARLDCLTKQSDISHLTKSS